MSKATGNLKWLWVTVLILILDRATKLLALLYLNPHQPKYLFSFFNLTLAFNYGAAFSFLSGESGWQRWFFAAIAIIFSVAILIWLARMPKAQKWQGLGLALILGGALGNLYDRVIQGYVIDFIQWHVQNYYWPIFNIADSAVCVGAGIMIITLLFSKKDNV